MNNTEKLAASAEQAAPAVPAYTEGHCKEKAKPGGCQLHNLQCGYPACDRKTAPAAPAPEATQAVPADDAVTVGTDWTPCVKLPVTVHVRQQRPCETHISTREGITPVKPDDYIMRGVQGEEYPIGRAIFERTYRLCAAAPAAPAPEAKPAHPDDLAVDAFAQAMKDKLAKAREKGRGGWQTCPPEELSRMLREHVKKGDPRDMANFAMFLWNLGHGIAPAAPAPEAQAGDSGLKRFLALAEAAGIKSINDLPGLIPALQATEAQAAGQELPPLPEVSLAEVYNPNLNERELSETGTAYWGSNWREVRKLYTADQMRAYARAALAQR